MAAPLRSLCTLAAPAAAQTGQEDADQTASEEAADGDVIVVSGYRQSLERAAVLRGVPLEVEGERRTEDVALLPRLAPRLLLPAVVLLR